MAITKSGSTWRGGDLADLAEYLRSYQGGGHTVSRVEESVCGQCDGRVFRVLVDADEGCAQRICVACESAAFIGDSSEYWEDADPGECACPCGGGAFAGAVGFSVRPDGSVKWINVGLRCLTDGTMGVYADWKIDYDPSEHLLHQA